MFKKLITKDEVPELKTLMVEVDYLVGDKTIEVQDTKFILVDSFANTMHDVSEFYMTEAHAACDVAIDLVKIYLIKNMNLTDVTFLWDKAV